MPRVHRGVALAIENALVEVTQCMHNETDRESNENAGGIFLRFMGFY